MNRITLFLMSEKGYITLKKIINTFGADVIDMVVIGFDKNVTNDYSKKIFEISKEHDIKAVGRNSPYSINTMFGIAISWRWIIPVKDHFQLITLHDSLLPKYRGFSPLVNQLINNEKKIGVSAILCNNEYDNGDIIFQVKTVIQYPIKIKEAVIKISGLYVEITIKIIDIISNGKTFKTISQNEFEASYSLWRNEDDYAIDWNQNASYIKRFIDAVGEPYKGASSKILGKKIRIYEANEELDVHIVNRDCGKIIFIRDGFPIIVCGKGLLKITKAQYDDSKKSIFPLNKFRIQFK